MAKAVRERKICAGAASGEANTSKKGRLILECDEAWSFVGNKGNKQWIWLAINRDTREIVGMQIGDRTSPAARSLWASLPAVYRQCAVCFTDFWEAYETVLPSKRPKSSWQGQRSNQPHRTIQLYVETASFEAREEVIIVF